MSEQPSPLFYWKTEIGDYVAVIRYNKGEPVWLNAAQSIKVLSVEASSPNPLRAHPSTKFPPTGHK